eukprot:11133631-Karenia_brevis.AAC.1
MLRKILGMGRRRQCTNTAASSDSETDTGGDDDEESNAHPTEGANKGSQRRKPTDGDSESGVDQRRESTDVDVELESWAEWIVRATHT